MNMSVKAQASKSLRKKFFEIEHRGLLLLHILLPSKAAKCIIKYMINSMKVKRY